MWLLDIAVGAVTRGVNKSTWSFVNVVFLVLIGNSLLLGLVARSSYGIQGILFVLPFVLLIVALVLSLNWFLVQTGTVQPKDQYKELLPSKDEVVFGKKQ